MMNWVMNDDEWWLTLADQKLHNDEWSRIRMNKLKGWMMTDLMMIVDDCTYHQENSKIGTTIKGKYENIKQGVHLVALTYLVKFV